MKIFPLVVLALFAAHALHAQDAQAFLKKGDDLDKALKNKEALQAYLEADRLQPNRSETLRLIAREYALMMADTSSKKEKTALINASLDFAQRAVKADPKNARAHLALAICYGRVAELQSAKQRIEYAKKIEEEAALAVALDPNEDYAWHVLGRWNYEIANLNPVLAFFAEKFFGKLPHGTNARAIECFRKAIALNSTRVVHHAELGRAYAAVGDKAKARQELEKALSLPSVEKDDSETKARAQQALAGL